MKLRDFLLALNFLAIAVGLGFAAVLTQPLWHPRLFPQKAVSEEDAHAHKRNENRLLLSAQARKNIGLKLQEMKLQAYQSTVRFPAVVVPQPGKTNIKVTTPVGGIVEKVHAYPGQLIEPGQELFSLHLHYHEIQQAQSDLHKAGQEWLINQKEQQRIKPQIAGGTVAQKDLLLLEYEQKRLEITLQALQANLVLHGFSKDQVKQIHEKGKFVTEWMVQAPKLEGLGVPAQAKNPTEPKKPALFEMSQLLVKIGDQAEAGKPLCILANYQYLFVEAQVFQPEIPLIEEAIQRGKPVGVEILDLAGKEWMPGEKPLHILFVEPQVDPASQTAGVFLELPNPFQEYTKGGNTYRLWKYRPGQKVYLTLPDKSFDKVFVLPRQAVAQDGLDTFVFSAKGDALVRTPVHVLHQDQYNSVIANDGSIFPRDVVAVNGADQLLRALKMKSQGGGHDHGHAGHSHDH